MVRARTHRRGRRVRHVAREGLREPRARVPARLLGHRGHPAEEVRHGACNGAGPSKSKTLLRVGSSWHPWLFLGDCFKSVQNCNISGTSMWGSIFGEGSWNVPFGDYNIIQIDFHFPLPFSPEHARSLSRIVRGVRGANCLREAVQTEKQLNRKSFFARIFYIFSFTLPPHILIYFHLPLSKTV